MALYVVIRENPIFKDKFVVDTEDGMVQQVKLIEENGVWKPIYQYGIEVPLCTVRDFLLRVQSKGIDERGLRG